MIARDITKIGTLGNTINEPNCTTLAIKGNFGESAGLVSFSTFEQAAEALIDEEIDAMAVPYAYPNGYKLIMNKSLLVSDIFTFIIPSLVFGSKEPNAKAEYKILFNHAATDPLVNEINAEWGNQVHVNSNSAACLNVLENTDSCCAITNSACAQQYGLYSHQILRAAIKMPFVVFIKNRKYT